MVALGWYYSTERIVYKIAKLRGWYVFVDVVYTGCLQLTAEHLWRVRFASQCDTSNVCVEHNGELPDSYVPCISQSQQGTSLPALCL